MGNLGELRTRHPKNGTDCALGGGIWFHLQSQISAENVGLTGNFNVRRASPVHAACIGSLATEWMLFTSAIDIMHA